MATVSGVWVWKEILDIGDGTYQEFSVNFTSNETSFTGITITGTSGPDENMVDHSYKIMDYSGATSASAYYSIDNGYGWGNNSFKIIDFGSTPQTVSDTLYIYLSDNATQQAGPAPTPDWSNCFVKTASGNKAVEKVWIKQNGQLVTVYDGG